MRYEDASHTSAFQGSQPIANDDLDSIPAGSKSPATGNLISGEGTQTGSAGADVAPGAHVAAIAGKGGEDSSFSGGKLSVSGEHGRLSVDAEGNYSYLANAGVENVRDRFTYTLADNNGATDTGALIVEIGKTPVVIKANAQQIVPGPDGVVTLPPGVELSDIRVVGRNLVIDMPDGTQLIIIDGAIFVPQLVLNGVEIPSTNLAALLIGQEPQPAAGEAPQSGGGDFDRPVPPLDPGVPLGDLIPPTEYDYTPPEPQEVDDILDREPAIQIQPDGQPASVNAVDSVDEDGLPTRNGGEPEGSDEGADGNPSNNSDTDEATSGVILIDSPDGVDSVTINGVLVTGAIGQVIPGEFGNLTITGFDGQNILYTYTLTDNIDHSDAEPDQDDFTVVLTDDDGDTATATLTIDIIDDVPTARDDTDAVIKGSQSTDGNVMSGVGTTSSPAGIDTVGADDAEVTGVHAGASGSFTSVPDGGVTIVGQFGDLTLFPDGSYTYTLHAEVGNGGNDVFTYQLTDGDGDIDTATLTIIAPPDLKPTLDAPNVGEAGTVVDEAGLPTRPGEPEGSGEEVAAGADGDPSEATTGTINFTPGDTPATITINGFVVTGAIGQTFAGDYGTLTITGFNANGSITYSYVLEDNVDHDTDLTPFEEFDIVVTDVDGDAASDTLRIDIVDDAPVANDDTDSVTEDGPLVANGNVVTGVGSDGNPAGDDLVGADDSIVTNVDGLNPGVGSAVATPGGVAIVGQYGTLVIQSDGSYTYTLDNTNPVVQAMSDGDTLTEQFEYTLLDNDGDEDTAVLTITINGDDDVPTVDVPTQGEDGTLVYEAGLPPRGSEPEGTGEGADGLPNNESDDSEITSGVITYTPGDGATTITIDGVVVAVGAVVPGDYGTLVITAFDPVAHTISYTYTLADNVDHDSDATPFETFSVVVSDSDGNPADDATGDLIIDIINDAPIARDDTDSVVEGDATNGNVLTGVGGDGNPAGADTPGADDYAPSTVVGVVTGGNDAVDTNNPATVGVVIVGTYGNLVLNADGSYTYTATADDPPENAEDVFTYTIIDNDGNMDSATLTIDVIADLTPDVPENTVVGLDDDALAGGNPGGTDDDPDAVNTSGSVAAVSGDGTIVYALSDAGAPGGFSYELQPNGDLFILQGTTHVLTVTLDQSGNYEVTQINPIDHPAGDDENNVDFTVTFSATDEDGDFDEGTLSISVDDDTPIVSANKLTHTVDEDGVVENAAPGIQNGDGVAGGPDDAAGAVVQVNGNVSALFSAGADTPLTYNIGASVASLTAQGLTSGGVPLSYSVNLVAGVYTLTATAGPGGETVFTLTLNATTGAYTFTLVDQLDHAAVDVDGDNSENELVVLLGSMIQATDADGDTVTAAADGLNITVDDDSPIINSATDLDIENDATPSGTGTFDFDIGADQNSDNDDITVSNFAVSVNGVPLDASDFELIEGTENAATASYSFSFEYDTGSGGTATAEGTLVFNKLLGTYTVELTNGPIQGFSILQTASGTLFQGYEFGTSNLDGSQPEISVTQIQGTPGDPDPSDLFVQFTSVSEPSSGTGDDNLEVNTWVPGADNPPPVDGGGDTSWSAGQLFNQDDGWVSTSGSANGTDGDTIQGGEVLDFTLVQGANPTGILAQPATFGQATTMFLKFDGIGASEDMIVILKLYDPNTDTYTTRAVMIQNTDIQHGPGAGPGVFSNITLDNNDGLVIIEPNDYNAAGENWVIVGAQIAGSDEGVTGTAINLNGAIGAGGDSDADNNGSLDTQAFSTDVDNGPFKISSIGFVTESTQDQSATIDFDVTIEDADGDAVTQSVTVNIGDPPADALAFSTMEASSEPANDTSSSSLLASDSQDQQLQKTAANSNTLTLSAAIAAAGLAETQAVAAPAHDSGNHGHQAAVELDLGLSKLFAASVSDGDRGSRSALSNETQEAANDSAPVESSSNSSDPAESDHVLDDSSANAEAQSSDLPAANDQGPAPSSVEASSVAMAVGMPSVEALLAAGVAGNAKHGGAVEQIVAEALGHGNAPDTVDALLNALPGGNGAVGALANVASPAANAVPGGDMLGLGAFAPGHDMMMNMHVAMHHDAVQPVANG